MLILLLSTLDLHWVGGGDTYMPHVAADLPATHEEVEGCHPLVGAKSRLASEVVKMRHEPRH